MPLFRLPRSQSGTVTASGDAKLPEKVSAVQHERNQAAPARFRQREESMAARIRGKFMEQPPIKTNVVNRAQKYSETLDRDSIGAGRDAKRQM